MSEDCKPRIPYICEMTELEGSAADPVDCQPWEVCLPFGAQLAFNGGCVTYSAGDPPPDGVYGKLVITNGCITGVEPEDVAMYTGSPCAPVPCDCNSSSSGGALTPSSTAGNLYTNDAAGRPLVRLFVRGEDGIDVIGRGTSEDPLIIAPAGGEEGQLVYINSGNAPIIVEGSGSRDDPYRVAHADGKSATYKGLVFDRYGHLISATEAAMGATVNGVVAGEGITAATDSTTGIVTVEYPAPTDNLMGTYLMGGMQLKLDFKNRVIGIEQTVSVPADTYDFGPYDVTLNEMGSVTELTDTLNAGVSYSAALPLGYAGGESQHSMIFTMRHAGYLRFRVLLTDLASVLRAVRFQLDGRAMTAEYTHITATSSSDTDTDPIGRGEYLFVTQGAYAAGSHTFSILLNTSQTFSESGSGFVEALSTWPFDG